MKKSTILLVCISLVLLILSGLTLWLEGQHSSLHIPRMIIGSLVVLLLPGYWITRWTFPVTEQEAKMDEIKSDTETLHTIDGLERFVLSIALSISAVPLLLFYVNFL